MAENPLADFTVEQLEALKTEAVAEMRRIEDQIEVIEEELQARLSNQRAADVADQVQRLLAGLPANARQAVIAGATAGAGLEGASGKVG